jgi:hypothetical protein
MSTVSQRMRVKTAETVPAVDVWNSPEDFFPNVPAVTRVQKRLSDPTLESLLDKALRQSVSRARRRADLWGTDLEKNFTGILRVLERSKLMLMDAYLEQGHVKRVNRSDPWSSWITYQSGTSVTEPISAVVQADEKATDYDKLLDWLSEPTTTADFETYSARYVRYAPARLYAYEHVQQGHIRDLWSSWINTSATEPTSAVVQAIDEASAVRNRLRRVLEWLSEPTRTADPLAHFETYSARDWDGYGAEPIAKDTIEAARLFLQMLPDSFGRPDIAPGSDGTIGLEWVFDEGPLKKLFVDIGPGQVWSAYWRRRSGEQGGVPHEKITSKTKIVLAKLFEDLSA